MVPWHPHVTTTGGRPSKSALCHGQKSSLEMHTDSPEQQPDAGETHGKSRTGVAYVQHVPSVDCITRSTAGVVMSAELPPG